MVSSSEISTRRCWRRRNFPVSLVDPHHHNQLRLLSIISNKFRQVVMPYFLPGCSGCSVCLFLLLASSRLSMSPRFQQRIFEDTKRIRCFWVGIEFLRSCLRWIGPWGLSLRVQMQGRISSWAIRASILTEIDRNGVWLVFYALNLYDFQSI